jgi:hypothetical protein
MGARVIDETATVEAPVRVIERTADHLIASWLHFVFVVWRGETTIDGVHVMSATLAEVARSVGYNAAAFIIAEESASAPPPEVRTPIVDMLRTAPLSACGVTLEGSGFGTAARLAFATGVGLLARPPFLYRPFSSVTETAMWLAHQRLAPFSVSALALMRAVSKARSASDQLPITSGTHLGG